MNFKESLEYLYGLGYELSVKKFGLENTVTILNALGNPQKNFLKVQVAGTNGKGSTCAFLESICVEAGIKVGLNTSPHLVSVTERIKINGSEISEKKFAEYVTKVREVSEGLVKSGKLEALPTFFEHITVIAQMFFANEKVEIAILETGLGGRFDATTATNAEIVAITPIDLDHTNILGDTIEEIASEKAAIIRHNTKVLSSPQKNEARKVIEEKCTEQKVELIRSESNIKLRNNSDNLGLFSYKSEKTEYIFDLILPGWHQRTNAALAIHIAEVLQDYNFNISKQEIEKGLGKTRHKGRLEYWNDESGATILFDGAHNVAGAKVLRKYLFDSINEPITMIFGAMGGKNLGGISKILFPLAKNLIFTTPENPRAMKAKEIAEFVPENFDKSKVFTIDEIPKAIEKAREISSKNLILVTGSLYLIGEVQKELGKK